jgi:polyisoprenyl-phosphate glycosyltransferase
MYVRARGPAPEDGCGEHIVSERLLHSVVVPAFNESAAIDAFHTRCSAALAKLPDDYEIVYVDDGSRDDTWARLSAIAERDPHVNLVRFSRNFGHQIAITAGQDRALGQTVITIDADLQDPPELIPEMISRWRDGADIVYAVRTERKGETAFKTASASVFYRVLRRLADVDMPVDVGDFRLLSRRAADALQSMPEQHRYVRGMVAWMGFETASVGYVRDPRTAGETKYPLGKMIRFAADGILAFSVRPLRIATWLGLLTSCAAFAYALWLIFARITGVIPSVDGWTSLMVLILLLAGVQLMTIGALGEYVGRIYTEVRHRPLYLVSETLGEGE